MVISATTRTLALLGDPVEHSLSPRLHNAGLEALGLDYVYIALRVARAEARAAFSGLRALGICGVNVTMPLKAAALRLSDRASPEAQAVGAANTVVNEGGDLVAHNTDVEGFVRAVSDGLGLHLEGVPAVVIGAGGAARAAVFGLAREQAGRVVVLGRRLQPTQEAAALAGSRGKAVPLSSPAAAAAVARSRLIVNATPLGMSGDAPPSALLEALGPDHAVIDLVYSPPDTPLLVAARAAGARAIGGLGMLIHQAGLAFTLFTAQPAPLETMSAAAVAALVHERPVTPEVPGDHG